MRVGVAEQGAGPGGREMGNVVSPVLVLFGFFDDVIGAGRGIESDGEAPGETLDVVGIGVVGGVGFVGLLPGFGARDVFASGERQEIAEFCCVEEVVGGDDGFLVRVEMTQGDGAHVVAFDIGGNGLMTEEEPDLSLCDEGLEHGFEHGEADFGFVAEF